MCTIFSQCLCEKWSWCLFIRSEVFQMFSGSSEYPWGTKTYTILTVFYTVILSIRIVIPSSGFTGCLCKLEKLLTGICCSQLAWPRYFSSLFSVPPWVLSGICLILFSFLYFTFPLPFLSESPSEVCYTLCSNWPFLSHFLDSYYCVVSSSLPSFPPVSHLVLFGVRGLWCTVQCLCI